MIRMDEALCQSIKDFREFEEKNLQQRGLDLQAWNDKVVEYLREL